MNSSHVFKTGATGHHRGVAVRCADCHYRTTRIVKTEGPKYGACPKCGGLMARTQTRVDQFNERAKRELRGE